MSLSLTKKSLKKLPKVIVFDLDYTLWPFWVDTHVTPPFRINNGKVVDHLGARVSFYPEVPDVLESLFGVGIELGVASRTSEIEGANELIDLFGWRKYFKYVEIYPGSKVTHFRKIHNASKVEYSEMIFFDDEMRNIKDLTEKGVHCVFVEHGVNKKLVESALKNFAPN